MPKYISTCPICAHTETTDGITEEAQALNNHLLERHPIDYELVKTKAVNAYCMNFSHAKITVAAGEAEPKESLDK